jgi:large subunit ribosomal protein L1
MSETVLNAIKEARGNSKKRNFSQTFDLIVNVKLLDLKRPENRLSETFTLPKGRGKDATVVVFSDSVKDGTVEVHKMSEIEAIGADKRALKKLARDTDFFLAEPKAMPIVGKALGRVLAPRGKMPSVLAGDAAGMIAKHKNSVKLKMKDSPVIQCTIGTESMKDEDLAQNIVAVVQFLEKRLPKGRNNVGKIMIKLTMGKPVKVVM